MKVEWLIWFFNIFFCKSQATHAYYNLIQIDEPYYTIIAYFFIHLRRKMKIVTSTFIFSIYFIMYAPKYAKFLINIQNVACVITQFILKYSVKTIHIFQNPPHGPSCDNTQKPLMMSHL
jgi:hypothetical protein